MSVWSFQGRPWRRPMIFQSIWGLLCSVERLHIDFTLQNSLRTNRRFIEALVGCGADSHAASDVTESATRLVLLKWHESRGRSDRRRNTWMTRQKSASKRMWQARMRRLIQRNVLAVQYYRMIASMSSVCPARLIRRSVHASSFPLCSSCTASRTKRMPAMSQGI